MEKILGLDLGTNSIGWAIRLTDSQLDNQIVDKGVLIFEKGVGEVKGVEVPLVKKRTDSRQKRRNYQAEKYRKWKLLEALISRNMCPLTIDELNEWRHYHKERGRMYPQSKAFIQWLRFDFDGDGKPDFERFGFDKHESYYLFRVLAISEKKEHLEIFRRNPQILGRIFYQLVQRRGFKGRDEEEAKTMLEGSKDGTTKGRDDVATYIHQYKTLGAALYHLQRERNERIRKRYNLRSDFEVELIEICRVQGLEDALYKLLWKAIIWQRPLRTQKGLIGVCTFEKNKPRCSVSHPLYEEFRTWSLINNFKIIPPVGKDKMSYILEKIYPLFYNATPEFKISTIRKQLIKDKASMEANFKDETKVPSCRLLNTLSEVLGNDWKEKYGWSYMLKGVSVHGEYSIEDIWHILSTFDDRLKLKEFAIQKLNLEEGFAEKLSKVKLQQGFSTLSIAAIRKILPFLYRGHNYSESIYLANLPKVFGTQEPNDELISNFSSIYSSIRGTFEMERLCISTTNNLISDHVNSSSRYVIEDDRSLDTEETSLVEQQLQETFGSRSYDLLSNEQKYKCFKFVSEQFRLFLKQPVRGAKGPLFLKMPNLHERLKEYLIHTYALSETQVRYLWHPSDIESYLPAKQIALENGGMVKQLGDPQPISRGFRNPMALKTLHKLKHLLNYLLKLGKIDEDTRVVVEIARELNDSNRRKAIEKWQRDREKQNDEFRKIIDEINAECGTSYNRDDSNLLDKVRLWKEQGMHCIYTGSPITMHDLFNGNKYEIEHTIPASISFDNELKNLTLADAYYNKAVKQKRLPTECPNYVDEALGFKPIVSNLEALFGKRKVVVRKVGKI